MIKNVLVIDDDPDQRQLEALRIELEEEVNLESSITFTVNLHIVNPLDYLNLNLSNNNYDPLFNYLQNNILDKKLDMFLCDFNMHAKNKYIAFEIIEYVRSKNKSCNIILYSGSPLKELTRINYNDLAKKIFIYYEANRKNFDLNKLEKRLDKYREEEELPEELLAIAIKSGITSIVARNHFDERAKEYIKKPSLLLRIEDELLKNGELLFNDSHEKLNGMQLKEVARHIREQTEEGIYFTEEIVKISLSNLINFNS